MIINNEKDRMKFVRELLGWDLPYELMTQDEMKEIAELVKGRVQYEDPFINYEYHGIGEHPSGYTNDGGRDLNDD